MQLSMICWWPDTYNTASVLQVMSQWRPHPLLLSSSLSRQDVSQTNTMVSYPNMSGLNPVRNYEYSVSLKLCWDPRVALAIHWAITNLQFLLFLYALDTSHAPVTTTHSWPNRKLIWPKMVPSRRRYLLVRRPDKGGFTVLPILAIIWLKYLNNLIRFLYREQSFLTLPIFWLIILIRLR